MKRLKPTFVLLLLGPIVARAPAQMIVRQTIDSLDTKVVEASGVVVGKVVDYTPTAQRNDYGLATRDVTIAVERTIKGKPQAALHLQLADPAPSLERWKRAANRLLIAVPVTNDHWERIVDLDDPDLLVSTEEFALLRDPERIVRYAMEAARRTANVRFGRFTIDPPKNDVGTRWQAAFSRGAGLNVPADAVLERYALERLRGEEPGRRAEAVRLLEPFKSKANVDRLKRLLRDPSYRVTIPPEDARAIENRAYIVRDAAYDTLRSWGESVAKPVVQESVSRLSTVERLQLSVSLHDTDDLSWLDRAGRLRTLNVQAERALTDAEFASIARRTGLTHLSIFYGGVGDARLATLSALRELRFLELDGNPVTDDGLRAIAAFPHLEEVDLIRTKVTDAGLSALRRARPGLRVRPEWAEPTPAFGALIFSYPFPLRGVCLGSRPPS